MNAISQQVTKSAAAKGIESALGVKTQMRGLAGNHTLNKGPVLQRKCACGGQCDSCKKPEDHVVQTKLAVSVPGDRYEQEADRVADQVLSAPAHGAIEASVPRIQRFAGHSAGQADAAPKSVDSVLRNQGRPLNPILREGMQQRFGVDFSQVRVHSGAAAEKSAREVNAHAYTVGHDIVFGPGRFAPSTQQGQRLIAHELTHVVQQSGASGGAMSRQVQRKVVDDDEHVTCRSTRANSVSDLIAAEDEAANLADRAAAAIRARPLAESTHKSMWERFRLNFNYSRDRCRLIPEIANRFTRLANAIRSTETTYWCTAAGEPEEFCKGRFARTFPGEKIALCSRFWQKLEKKLPDQKAPTILHEWAHYEFESRGIGDEPAGGFDTAECYAAFAYESAERPYIEFEDMSKCDFNPHELPTLDQANLGLPCPRRVFLNIAALGGLTTGVPGSSSYAGVGLDLRFPIRHGLELAVGTRFREFGASPKPDDWNKYQIGAQVGLAMRKQPSRFGYQFGAFVEGGLISMPGETGDEARIYGVGGLSVGANLRIGRETVLQILAEAGVGKAWATETERGFGFLQAGLSFGISYEGF